jgi:hypothetical protein
VLISVCPSRPIVVQIDLEEAEKPTSLIGNDNVFNECPNLGTRKDRLQFILALFGIGMGAFQTKRDLGINKD